MKKIILLFTVIAFIAACSTNTITGRKQLSLFAESTLQQAAVSQYQSFLSENKVINQNISKDAEMVKRVGTRIAQAITSYYAQNAWCMPGGKVVVYTGLLGITQNEAALAVVLGHEITHAVAHHGNERMSQVTLAQGLEIVGNIATANNPKYNTLFNNIYAPTAQIGVLLPNSRNQEYEADHYGLIFSAMSGYNPREAIPFWQRMAKAGGNSGTPEFLATHPSDENRIAKLESYMNEALSYYKPVNSNN